MYFFIKLLLLFALKSFGAFSADIDDDLVYQHLAVINEVINEDWSGKLVGTWNKTFGADELVCIDSNCERTARDYFKTVGICAVAGTGAVFAWNGALDKQLTGPLLGKFLKNRIILMSIGFPYPVAASLVTAAFASGCIPAILYTISEGEKQIAQCKKDLVEARHRNETSAKIDALIKQQENMRRFIEELKRQSNNSQ